MRYSREQVEEARQRLLAQGGAHAKAHGFGESGMAALAGAAGVTTGSLYKQFPGGKDEFFAAVVAAELQRTVALYAGIDAQDKAAQRRAVLGYLSQGHVEHPEAGCPLPALTAEVARAPQEVKAAMDDGLSQLHACLADLLGDPSRAWVLISQTVGAVMLARALPPGEPRQALLASARRTCEALI